MIDLNLNFKKFIYIYLLYWSFSYNTLIVTKTTNIIDLNWRLFFNETFLFYYYFFWTNFWYIYLYIVILIVLFYFKKKINLNYFFLIVCYLVIFYYLDYYTLNTVLNKFSTFNKLINNLLSNKFNKIHPLLFYTTVTLILYVNIIKKNKVYLYFIFFIIWVSLLLGSWWALQEGSWGGWWNWDASEVFGLIIFFYSIVLLHTNSKLSLNFYYRQTMLLYLLLIYLFYILLQLNFSIASHNFGNFSAGNYLYKSYALIIFVILIIFIVIICTNLAYNLNYIYIFYKNDILFKLWIRKFFYYFKWFFFVFIIYILYNSYLIILNNFPIFINLFLIKTNFKIYRTYLVYIYILFFLFLRGKSYLYILNSLIFSLYNNFFILINVKKINNKYFLRNIHYLVLLLLYFNFNILWKSALCFYDLTYYSNKVVNNNFFYYNYNNLTLDNSYFFVTNYFVHNNIYLNYTTIQNSFWRKIYITKLSLPWSYNIVWQGLYRLKYQLKYLLFFSENNIYVLLLITVFILVLYIKFYFIKRKIIV